MTDLFSRLAQTLDQKGKTIENEAEYLVSAIVVPLLMQDNKISVLFEVRSETLARQPGEICFPGGRVEASDTGLLAAALRETSEELGIDRGVIHPLGPLNCVIAPIGVLLHPFVAYIEDGTKLSPNPDEVAKVFTIPLDCLLMMEPQIAHMELATRPKEDFPIQLLPAYQQDWQRRYSYTVLFYEYESYVIWGLTARVLANFIRIVKAL